MAWQKSVRGSFSGVLNVESGATLTFDEAVTARRVITEKRLKAEARMKLLPGSWSLSVWRSVMVVIVAWTVVVAPLEIAFSWWETPDWLSAIGTLVDVLFIFDMFLNFNVAYMHHGRLVTDHRHIAMNYVRTWFLPDFIINIPWNLLLEGSSGKSRKVAKVLKLPKIFRLTRLLRVAREEAQYFGTAFAFLGLVLLAHYCACMWALLLIDCGENRQCPDIVEAYLEAFSVGVAVMGGSDAWMRFVLRGQHAELSGKPQDWRSSPFDWAAAGAWADIGAAASCLGGFVVLGVLFSTVSKAMERSDAHTRLFHERLWNLSAVMQRHDVDESLLKRARRHYHYLWSCGSDVSRAILQDSSLTADLRRQFAFAFYGGLLRQVPFLGSAHQSFIKQLCSSVEVEVFSPMDRIIIAGEANTELYFIAVGRVSIEAPDSDEVLKILDEGSFFGEMGLLFPESRRTVNVVGQLPGWLLVVPRSALESLCTDELLEAFRAVALERLQQFNTRGLRLSDVPEGAEFVDESSDDDVKSGDTQSECSDDRRVAVSCGRSEGRFSSSGGSCITALSRRVSISSSKPGVESDDNKRMSLHSETSAFSIVTSGCFRSHHLDVPMQASPSSRTSGRSAPDAGAAVAAASTTWRAPPSRRVSTAVVVNQPRSRMTVSPSPGLSSRMNQTRKSPNMGEATKASANAKLTVERHRSKNPVEGREAIQETFEASSLALVDKLATKVQSLVTDSLAPLGARLGALESRLASVEANHSPMSLSPVNSLIEPRTSDAARAAPSPFQAVTNAFKLVDMTQERLDKVAGASSSSEPHPVRTAMQYHPK